MTEMQQRAPWQARNGFIISQCGQCEMGWTRTGRAGGVLTVCLLDREPVPDILSCDQLTIREQETALKETAA
jgi:hypothetical protein